MTRVSVTVEGGDELVVILRKMGAKVENVLKRAALRGAKEIVDDANPRAPEPLIEAQVTDTRPGRVDVSVGWPDAKWPWKFLETGAGPHLIKGNPLLVFEGDAGLVRTAIVNHPGMAARPMLRPAFDERSGAAADMTGELIKQWALK